MDTINKSNSKLSYEELLEQNTQLKKQIKEINQKPIRIVNEYKRIQEIVHIGTWYLDLATNEVEWTEELFKMYGFDPTLPVPPYTEHMKLFTEESWELLSKSLANTAETGIPYELELKTVKKDESNGWMWVRGETVMDATGKTIGLWGAAQDITDKKNAENELKKTESIQRKMVANIGDVIVIIDKNGINRYKSPNVKRQFGWEVDELVGKSAFDKVHPDHIESAKELLSDLVHEPEKTITTELLYLRKDGEYRWIEITISNLLYDPEIDGFLGNYHDITERKLDEEALRSSQEMLLTSQSVANICSYSTDLIVTDIDKSQWECSPEFYNIFGIDETYPHTIKGWIGFLHPDYRKDVAAYHESVILEKKSFNREYKIIRINDGVERWVHGTGELVYDINGNPIRMHGAIQDITEHKLAELALKESENKFKTLFKDNNSIQLLIAPSTGNIIDANQAACDFYGYAYEKLTALSIQDINQYSEEEVKQEMNSAKEKKRNYFEFTHKLKDGTIREVEVFSNPISIDNVQYLISIIHDVTTKKRAERELINAKKKTEESEKILKTTLQTAMDGYWVVDIKGRFLNVNDTYCRMSGFDREQLLNMNISDIEAIQSPDEINENKKRIKQIGQLRFETKHVRKDGTLYDVEMGIQYQESNDGQFVCFIKDITEQKKHEAAIVLAKEVAEQNELKIKLNEQRLMALVELNQMTDKSDDFIYDFTLNKAIELTQSKIGFLGFVNDDESQVDIYKWSDSAMKDCAVENFNMNFIVDEAGVWGDVIRQRKPLVLNDYSQAIPNKKGIPVGHVNIKNYLSIPTFQQNKIIAIISVANKGYDYSQTDINQLTLLLDGMRKFLDQRKEKEELINAKQKAEESDRLKSAFLANMSHEIRTPMNGILGFTTLLQDANLSVENQKHYIDIIEKSGNRLLNTVNDIIEISKIESGEIKVIQSEVDIIGHLNTLVTFFKPEAKKKSINIIMQNNIDGNDLSILTDKNKLSSILSNLIKNAIKYTNEGTINVGLKVENNQILFSCKDTGIGIPKNRQEAIFNRFEQADIEDKQAHQGSGLGLAIVKSYVEMLDGKIWVESEEGLGSTFYVSLPFKHEKKKKQIIPQEEKSSDIGIKNINVLVVEDDEYSSMHLSEILSGKVKNIISTRNGTKAIDTCKNDSSIDLILMDIKMPVMDGIEATKKIREFNNDVVIIAQTAYALQGDKQKALDAGCNDYISKPINKDKLFELINKYF